MKNFTFHNPTKLIFGKDSLRHLPDQLPSRSRILLTYGGGTIKRIGIYDQVINALGNRCEVFTFGGIEANPDVATIEQAVKYGREKEVNFVLAVGGGSVIDGSKLIACAIPTLSRSPWEIVQENRWDEALPLGTVLTVPATASEMNPGAVISNRATREKFSFKAKHPVFSILDPSYIKSLSKYQVACGIADAYVHVLEQYLTFPDQSMLMDRMAEGVLMNLIDLAPSCLINQEDYRMASEYMLSATVALNGFLRMGVVEDWLTHAIGHEITALCGTTHGASLVMVYPAVMHVLRREKGSKIAQYARRVWAIDTPDEERLIDLAIQKTTEFFASLGLATSMQAGGIPQEAAQEIVSRFERRHSDYGENGIATPSVIAKVIAYSMTQDPLRIGQ